MGDQPLTESDALPKYPRNEEVPSEFQNVPTPPPEVIVSTRTSRAWIRLLPLILVLVVILVFVFQNPEDVKVSFFSFSRTLPLSLAILGAVILGTLMTLALGSVRIFQLRRQVHRQSKLSKTRGPQIPQT